MTAAQLPEQPGPGVFLYDPRTGERFSADRRDYFMLADDDELPRHLVLAREHTRIEVMAS